MTTENRPEVYAYPNPSKDQVEEMSLLSTFHRIVDDLFANQIVAETLADIEDNEAMQRLVQTWKQSLTQHLAKTAQTSLENVVATLELFQTGEGASITDSERQEWQEIEARYTPFPVVNICREDLRERLPDEQIATLTDGEMEQIAAKMSDRYQDSGGYWNDLAEAARLVLKQRQGETNPSLTPPTRTEPDPNPSAKPEPHD